MSKQIFEDIKIVSEDKSKRKRTDREEIYKIYLTLNALPPTSWGDAFSAALNTPRSAPRATIRLAGTSIEIECNPLLLDDEDMKKIKDVVHDANQIYKTKVEERASKEEQRIQNESDQEKKIDEALNKLDFS
jgi:hypothetical protein